DPVRLCRRARCAIQGTSAGARSRADTAARARARAAGARASAPGARTDAAGTRARVERVGARTACTRRRGTCRGGRVPAARAPSVRDRGRPAAGELRPGHPRVVRPAPLRGLNPALAQREVALAGVALLAAVVAIAVTSTRGSNAGAQLKPVLVPGGGWYTAL